MTWYNKFEVYYLFNNILVVLLSIPYPCIIFYKHYGMNVFYYTSLECIKNYTKNPSYGFLTSWCFVHNRFMDLGNPFAVVVHYLYIGRMTCLGHLDKVPSMSALVCMVTQWKWPTMSHDIRLLDNHDFNKLLYCIVFQS